VKVPTVVYLTYHGLASPLGRAQCLPYIERLAARGEAQMIVVSYESQPLPDSALRRRVREAGIEWIELRYHGHPKGLAKLYDLALGLVVLIRATRGRRVHVIHARSYVMAALALVVRIFTGIPFVFDMLGMLADEYADVGYWDRRGMFYRATKALERALLRWCAAVIVLTEKHAAWLSTSRLSPTGVPVWVIPCCVDLERFGCAGGGFPRGDAPRIVYAGGIGTWYRLGDMLDMYAVARRITPDLHFRVITQADADLVRAAVRARKLDEAPIEVMSAHPDEMRDLLCSSDVGLSFITPNWSKRFASPNKFAEYLASGLPVITNAGVGDLDDAMSREPVGAVVTSFGPTEYERAWRTVLTGLERDPAAYRSRCRRVAERDHSVELGVSRYREIYAALMR
jgi:glycosyltransferase involved in cell wall biosynthesis